MVHHGDRVVAAVRRLLLRDVLADWCCPDKIHHFILGLAIGRSLREACEDHVLLRILVLLSLLLLLLLLLVSHVLHVAVGRIIASIVFHLFIGGMKVLGNFSGHHSL